MVWCTAVASAGYSLAHSWDTLEAWIGRTGLVALAAVVVVLIDRGGAQPPPSAIIECMIPLASGLCISICNFSACHGVIAAVVLHGPGRRGARRSRAVEHAAGARTALEPRGSRWPTCAPILLTHIHLEPRESPESR